MGHRLWLGIIVFVVVFAGTSAYRISARKTVSSSETKGAWTRVSESELKRSLAPAAAEYKDRWVAAVGKDSSSRTLKNWIAGGNSSNGKKSRVAVGRSAADANQLKALSRSLPDARKNLVIEDADWMPGGSAAEADLSGALVLKVNQTKTRFREIRTPFSATLTPSRRQPPFRDWQITRFDLPDKGLRVFRSPTVVESEGFTVVTSSDHTEFAKEAADAASNVLPIFSRRYNASGKKRLGSIYIVDNARQVRELLGRDRRPSTVTPSGWTMPDGDIVIDWQQVQKGTRSDAIGIVVHEVVHLATLDLFDKAPTLFLEGLATWEEVDWRTKGTSTVLDLRVLRSELRNKTLKYLEMVESMEPQFGFVTKEKVELGYLAGYATIGYLVDHGGYAKLRRFNAGLESGLGIKGALDRVYGLTPVTLKRGVQVWIADHVRKSGLEQNADETNAATEEPAQGTDAVASQR